MPDDKFLLELIESVGRPIVSTSCNYACDSPCLSMEEILPKFKEKVDIIVDGGNAKIGVPSTIIKVTGNNVNILRKGPISEEEILKCI